MKSKKVSTTYTVLSMAAGMFLTPASAYAEPLASGQETVVDSSDVSTDDSVSEKTDSDSGASETPEKPEDSSSDTSKEPEEKDDSEDPAPTEPPATTEPPIPAETEPPVETQPKTAYDYEFDINAIRADCIAIGQGMGYTLNTSLSPQNATWWNPITASESNQGSGLRSRLEQYIRFHTVENLSAYGLDEITEFNICGESTGGGSYAIYFVFA